MKDSGESKRCRRDNGAREASKDDIIEEKNKKSNFFFPSWPELSIGSALDIIYDFKPQSKTDKAKQRMVQPESPYQRVVWVDV